MKSTQIISIGLFSLLMLSPTIVVAQTATGGASMTTETQATSTGQQKTMGIDDWKASTAKISASTTVDDPSKGVISPRDTASGLPTGKRQHGSITITKELGSKVTASGTKPLGTQLEREMKMRDEAMERRASTTNVRKEERKEELAERKEERMQARGEMLKEKATLMITRMKAAIDRYSTLADRVDSRIAKLKANGINTTKAQASIAIARTKITEAKAAVALAESGIATAVITANADVSVKPIDAGKAIRESLLKARSAIEAAHKALVEAITSLRANEKIEGSVHATTTVAP